MFCKMVKCNDSCNCCSDRKELAVAVGQLIKLFEIMEESDSGHEFHPNTIRSCRVVDSQKIIELIKEIKMLL